MSIKDQPPPTGNQLPTMWDLVIDDMKERDNTGRERYGVPLQPFNGRDALVDAYQESLDLSVYLRQAIYEKEYLLNGIQEILTNTNNLTKVDMVECLEKLLQGE